MSRTNGVGLDLDAVLDVSLARVVCIFVDKNGLAAESVDEGSPACEGRRNPWSAKSVACWRREGKREVEAQCEAQGKIKLTSARCSADHQAELDTLLHVLLAANHLLLGWKLSVTVRTKQVEDGSDSDAMLGAVVVVVAQWRSWSPD